MHKEWIRRFGEGRLPVASRLLTLYAVLAAWIYFRATSFADAWTMAKAWVLFESPGARTVELWSPDPSWGLGSRLLLFLTPLLTLHVMAALGAHRYLRRVLPAWLITLLFGVLSAIALSLMPLAARPFIYFQF
ncbi:MAG: hypothetical protein KDC48_22040 [Planctomycetes bacterium]|nr:hypothetical protein [Planctomycetota bacterium]